MQLALYHTTAEGLGSALSRQRRETPPVERILEGELLRGDRRTGDDRRAPGDEEDFGAAEAQARGAGYVPPPNPGHGAIAAYLRTADPAAWSPPATLHVVV